MPDNTRMVGRGTQSYTLGDRRFIGLDTNTPANALDVGFFPDSTNLWVDGLALAPRPGMQAQLASSLANPIYSLIGYRTADGSSNRLFFVSSTSVYMHTVGTTTSTALSGTATWTDATQVRLKQHGKYIYGVPGKAGTALFRIDGTLTTPVLETIPNIQPPTINGVDFIKPVPTLRPVKIKTFAAQDLNVAATIATGGSAVITGTNTFSAGDRVQLLTSIGTNHLANTTYFVIATGLSGSAFQVSATLNGTAILASTTGTTTISLVNDIDNYYLTKLESDYAKTANAAWPSVWSSNLMKLTTGATTVPSGEFDGYVNGADSSTANFVADWNVSGASVHNNESWVINTNKTITSPPDAVTYGANTKKYLKLDNTGEYAQQIIEYLPTEKAPPSSTSTTIGLYNLQFYSFANIIKSEGSVKFKVSAYGQNADGDIPGCAFSKEYTQAYAVNESDWYLRDIVLDFREFAASITKIRIRFESTAIIGSQDILIDMVKLFAVASNLTAIEPATALTNTNGLVNVRFRQTNPNISPTKASYVKNKRLRIMATTDTGGVLDVSKTNALSFQWEFDSSLVDENGNYPNVVLGLQVGSEVYWSSIGEWDRQNRYMTFAMYELTLAQKTGVSYFHIKFLDDVLTFDSKIAYTQSSLAFSIGNMSRDSALQGNGTYEYAFTRWYPSSASAVAPGVLQADQTYATGFETGLSDISATVNTTSALASTSVVLNPNNTAGYGSNVCIDKRKMVVGSATDLDTWVSTYVPAASQIRVISTTAAPTFSYVNTSGTTVSSITWNSITAPDGTTYYVGTLPSAIRYVTATTEAIWLEGYVAYGYSSTSKYSHVIVYRRNNALFPDGRFRLIAVVPVDDTTTTLQTKTGNGWTATYTNGTSREITLIDEVPDDALFYETGPNQQGTFFEIGRDPMPLGTSALTTFQNRLWVSKSNKLYASWVIDQTDEYKMYTTELPDLTEPGVQKKGATFSVGGRQEKEIILSMCPMFSEDIQQSNSQSATLLVLKENSVTAVIGFDPTTFNVQLWVASPGVGISAPLSLSNTDGTVTWLSVNGLVQWAGSNVVARSTELRKLLSLDPTMFGAQSIDKSQYQASIVTTANKRIFLLSTASNAGAANQYVYVFDSRVKGWVKWKTISDISMTAMTSLSFGDDVQYVYFGSTTGQLFKLDGTADKSTQGGSDVAIAWEFLSRLHGQTYSEGPNYYANNRPYQIDLHVDNQSAGSQGITWVIQNQNGPYNATTAPTGASSTGTYTVAAYVNKSVAIRNIQRSLRGSSIQIKLSGSSTGKIYVRAVHLQMYDGNITR